MTVFQSLRVRCSTNGRSRACPIRGIPPSMLRTMNAGTLFVGPTRRSRRSTGERVFRWRRPVRLLGNGFIGPWSEQGRDQIWARFGERDGRLGHDQLFKAALGELLEGV